MTACRVLEKTSGFVYIRMFRAGWEGKRSPGRLIDAESLPGDFISVGTLNMIKWRAAVFRYGSFVLSDRLRTEM